MSARGVRRMIAAPLVIALLIAAVPPAAATKPVASSQSVGTLVVETDAVHGIQLLRPSAWESTDLRTRRVYSAPDGSTLTAVNLRTASAQLGPTAVIANLELFKSHPSLDAWISELERLWASLDLKDQRVKATSASVVNVIWQYDGTLLLVGNAIVRGQPLSLALATPHHELSQLADAGLLSDFELMVDSLKPVPVSETVTPLVPYAGGVTSEPSNRAAPASIESGPWHSDSGQRTVDDLQYRLETDYYQAPPRVYWLWEWIYYPYYSIHTEWLYRTEVTDYPQNSCVYGGSWSLLSHSIGKAISASNGSASDSYYPNAIVSHLNPSTAHMSVFGDPAYVYCQWYFPFTH